MGATLSLLISPSFADPQPNFRVTRVEGVDTLALRSQATTRSRIKAHIPFNASGIRYLNKSHGIWRYVRYASSTGWVSSKYLAPNEIGDAPYYSTHGYRLPDYLNIRSRPSSFSRIKGKIIEFETGLEGAGQCTTYWCPINYQGTTGWVNRRYIASWSP